MSLQILQKGIWSLKKHQKQQQQHPDAFLTVQTIAFLFRNTLRFNGPQAIVYWNVALRKL